MEKRKCRICNFEFDYKSGKFTNHLLEKHELSLKDYIVKYELSGKTPKCQCGYCEEDSTFFRGKFLNRIGKHQKYDWLKEQYIIKNGLPKCKVCGNDVKWNRGLPNEYCSPKCFPSRWNQEKVKETVIKKYDVSNVSFLLDVRKKISNKMKVKLYNPRKYFLIKKYKNSTLTYQSLYEYHFLEYCEKNNILDRVKNGNVYDFLPDQCDYGFRTLTDFCIDNVEIEIKSTYILEKQGGYDIINIKRNAVERAGKQYLLILDKNYKEFDGKFYIYI